LDGITTVPGPYNETPRSYTPSSPELADLLAALAELGSADIELTCTIGGEQRMGGGDRKSVVQPHRHVAVLGHYAEASTADAQDAIAAALAAAPAWRALSYDDRAAIFLRVADLLAGPWRARLNAATMLGQSKTVIQAEIDSACELIDFWRFNVAFGRQVLADQPISAPGVWNRVDHRPLEGFVYAITPFNFTAIAGNLPTAPALMGNVVIWKPSETQALAAHFTMRLLGAAGLPPGVINLLTGDGRAGFGGDARTPRSGRRALHRLHRDVPAPVAPGRRSPRHLPHVPARPAARTSSSPTRAPTLTSCARPSSAARSSTRGRSARRPRGPTSRHRSGNSCATA
jgi:1-pyrroline-5-carboxylate dehydrogenase